MWVNVVTLSIFRPENYRENEKNVPKCSKSVLWEVSWVWLFFSKALYEIWLVEIP
jgi:hypothetical protein